MEEGATRKDKHTQTLTPTRNLESTVKYERKRIKEDREEV